MKKFSQGATRILVLALGLGLVSTGWADFQKTNPVTGETENYTWKFVGTDIWNSTGYWQNSAGANPSGVPAKSGENTWDPILFDGKTININANMSVEGWNLRMGLYNGARVQMNTFVKMQGGTTMWITVDEASLLTIGGFGGGNITDNQVVKLSVARVNGIAWNVGLTSNNANNTFEYYLKGEGSVSYKAVSAANHKIKQADVTLNGNASTGNGKRVNSKTLVSFTSSGKTFTADATIKVKYANGDLCRDVALSSVTATTPTLTTSGAIGDCELVQTATGIVLYYVDYECTPSININFTYGDNPLNTDDVIGIAGYKIPGGSWNNIDATNGTTSGTIKKTDATGAAIVDAGISVVVSGGRGNYRCNKLPPAIELRHGYIDSNGDNATPTVTVSGIPFETYRVIVYHACDSAERFGYDIINGVNFTYVNGEPSVGTNGWGYAGAQDLADPIEEGINTFVSPVLSGETVTVGSHFSSWNQRGSIAAIQIVEATSTYTPSININFTNDAGNGLTTPFDVGLDGYKAPGTSWNNFVVANNTTYDTVNAIDSTGAASVASGVSVTVSGTRGPYRCTSLSPANSPLHGYIDEDANNKTPTVTISGIPYDNYRVLVYHSTDSDHYQFGYDTINGTNFTYVSGEQAIGTTSWGDSGPSNSANPIEEGVNTLVSGVLSGSTITMVAHKMDNGARGCFAAIQVVKVDVGDGNLLIPVTGDTTYTVSESNAYTKVIVSGTGTLTLDGSGMITADVLEIEHSSHIVMDETRLSATTVIGAGTAIYDNAVPATGKGWTDGVNWKGTVQVRNVTNMVGDSRAGVWLKFNDYGNSGSVVELNNVTGWLEPAYNCTVPLKITGTLTLNNGNSGKNYAFKVGTLLGSGTIAGSGSAPFMVFQILNDWSGFTGAVQLSSSKVVAFGSEIPSTVADANADAGTIYIAEGAEVEIKSSSWWAAGVGFVVDGTLKAASRDKWGGGTAITLGDTGVLDLSSTGNLDCRSKNFSSVTGTGTIRFSGSGWASLPDGANIFADTLSVELEQQGGVVCAADTAKVIGSIFGTKNLRSDLDGSGKTLTVKQAKDGIWSGSFHGGQDRMEKLVVQGGASSTGTLTLAGTTTADGDNTYTDKLEVASSGSVNLTGLWIGDTTVYGTFGGTGTLDGALTFVDGATFKANATALTVTGAVAFPAGSGDEVTVDLTGVTPVSGGTTLISSSTSMGSAINLTASGAALKAVGNDLKAYPIVATYGGKNYATFADAIDVALADEGGVANLANITVVDATAELPDWYVIQDNTIKAAVAAKVIPESSTTYYATLQEAVDNVNSESYVEIHDDSLVATSSVNAISIKPGAYTFTITSTKAGYGDFVQGTEILTGVYSYAPEVHAATFVWNGGASGAWNDVANWTSTDGTVAVPPSDALYTIDFSAAAAVSINSDKNVAQMNVGAAVSLNSASAENTYAITVASGGAVALTTVSASLAVTRISPSSTPVLGGELSPATYYVKSVTSGSTTTYSVDVYNTVTFTAPNATVTRADALGNAIKDGDTITFTISPDAGYKVTGVTAGGDALIADNGVYSYTVTADATITVATAQESSVEIGAATFAYGVDYTNATVTVAVTETNASGTEYTLTVNGKNYTSTATTAQSGTTVTFTDVEIPRGAAYGAVNYTITSNADTTTGETSGSDDVADVVNANWINENATTHGQAAAGGSWTNAEAVTYSEGKAEIGDNRFAATTASTASRVVLEFEVCFSSASEETVSGDAQAAIKLGEDDSVTTFKVLTTGNEWTSVSNAGLQIDPSETYNVVLTIDYGSKTYKVDVGGNALTNSAGVASFALASSSASVQNIDFAGSGTLTSLKGSQFEGYMVKDALNNFYATIQAATQAYNSANRPYTVLHDGTPPDGWRINETTKALIKIAKGFFFMAY